MSSRIAFDSWQMVFPAVGFAIFFVVFGVVVARVWRMKTPVLDRLNNLPLADIDEQTGSAGFAESPRNTTHVRTEQKQSAR